MKFKISFLTWKNSPSDDDGRFYMARSERVGRTHGGKRRGGGGGDAANRALVFPPTKSSFERNIPSMEQKIVLLFGASGRPKKINRRLNCGNGQKLFFLMQLFWNKIFGRIVDEAKKAKTGPDLLAHVDADADNDDANGNKNNARKKFADK